LNPREDYDWIVRGGVYHVLSPEAGEPLVPRIDLAAPDESLLLKKPTFAIPHGGGPRFDTDSQEYEAIANWVENGAPFEPEGGVSVPRIEEVAVHPEEIVLDGKGSHRLAVTARLSDGRTRDISDEVRYESQNRAVAMVDADGVVTAVKTGETNVLVRAAGHTVHARIGVIAEPIADYPQVPEWNFIDRHVIAKLKRFHLIPSDLSNDSEFLRRVCLDVIGTLPPPNRVREFLEDPDPDKRNKLIEILLDSPEFVDFWTFRFSDLLRVVQEPNYSQLYWEWIRSSVASDKPYDQMARGRLDAQGRDRPSRHYYENNSQPERILSDFYITLWLDLQGGKTIGMSTWNLEDLFAQLPSSARLQPHTSSSTVPRLTGHRIRAGSALYLHWMPAGTLSPTSIKVTDSEGGQIPDHIAVWALRVR
jgi:hypothetical protein